MSLKAAARRHFSAHGFMRTHPTKDGNGQFRTVLIIASAAALARFLVAIIAYADRDVVSMLWPRGVEVLGIARSLVQGEGFSSPFAISTGPTAFLPPLYPAMLAAIEGIFGLATKTSAWVILSMQCTLSALTCVPIYYLAAEVCDLRIARRAAWIWALFPYAIILPTNIIWESSLSALMLILGLLAFVRARESKSQLVWALVGAYWALASLANASFLLLFPALMLFQLGRNRAYASRTIWCLVTFLVCLLPWSIRNYAVLRGVFPLRDNFALELWIGNHEGPGAITHSDSEIHPAFNMTELQRYQSAGEISYMAEKRRLALAFIRERPFLFLQNTAVRFFTFWFFSWRAVVLLIPILSISGFTGLFLMLARSHARAWVFWIPLGVYPLPYYITHSDLKYQHPVQPLLAILCAYALTRYGKSHETSIREERTRPWPSRITEGSLTQA